MKYQANIEIVEYITFDENNNKVVDPEAKLLLAVFGKSRVQRFVHEILNLQGKSKKSIGCQIQILEKRYPDFFLEYQIIKV